MDGLALMWPSGVETAREEHTNPTEKQCLIEEYCLWQVVYPDRSHCACAVHVEGVNVEANTTGLPIAYCIVQPNPSETRSRIHPSNATVVALLDQIGYSQVKVISGWRNHNYEYTRVSLILGSCSHDLSHRRIALGDISSSDENARGI